MPKPRKCRCGCGEPIPDGNTLRIAATLDCALRMARATREKRERKELREAKARLKTRQQWLRDAQQAFNAWIRARDAALPCISCDRFHKGSYDAGHYRTVKAAPELRFDPDNCHSQCVPCNQHLSGNLIAYRKGLIARIGIERLERLEGPHEPRKYTVDELKALIVEYRAKRREIENSRS